MKTIWKRLRRYVDGGPSAPEKLVLTDPDLIEDFRNVSRTLRAQNPVCPVATGGVLLLDPEDVKHAFSHPSLSNQPSRFSALAAKNKDRYVAASVASNILPFLDGQRHVDIRQWASRAFFRQLRAFDGQIEERAALHCRQLRVDESYALVEDIARRFVVDVIGRFIGVDFTASEAKQFTTAVFRLFAPAADADTFAATNENLAQARSKLADVLQERRADQTSCLLNQLDQDFPECIDPCDRDLAIIDNALLFLADGIENVEAAIGIVMMRYAKTPMPITKDFVRTAIHADTPGQTIARIASQDLFIRDTHQSAGTPVFLSLASANDGSTNEDEFTFGRGRHKCLGENLAISMISAFCAELVDRKPEVDSTQITYRAMFGHKWPRAIRVTLTQ